MEPNFTEAPSYTAVFDQMLAETESLFVHQLSFSDDSFVVPDPLDLDELSPCDFDLSDFDVLNFPPPPPPTAAAVPVDSMSSEESNARASRPGPVGPAVGLDRGKSVVFDDLGGNGMAGGAKGGGEKKSKRRSMSVDASSKKSFKGEAAFVPNRAMNSEELAQLAKVDPKRVKRILANRISAAKSKESKMNYTRELQQKVRLLRIQTAHMYANDIMLERDTAFMAAENKELKVQAKAVRQQRQNRDAISDGIKDELWSLRNETDNLGLILSNRCRRLQLALQQTQHLMPNHLTPPNQSCSGHYDPNSSKQ